ncbi:Karyopherin transporter [Blastocladiella emersonii ATCC 22665]|nr:Karyopherin transporter [Blastocladiella emersonii ATCC 22665]
MDPQSLLDFSLPLNVALFDNVVNTFYRSHGAEQQQAQQLLTAFQEHPDAWTRADAILEQSAVMQSKYIALQILERLVQIRWKVMAPDARLGIKNYIVAKVISVSSNDALSRDNRQFLAKLNLVLVQILKQDWPHNWPDFIPELVRASRTNVPLCENNMAILKLLSEEIFDFSAEEMTQTKARTLKQQMCGEFSEVFSLCLEVLQASNSPSLVKATLATLLRFLNWIPLGYIFQTELIPLLTSRFLEPAMFRNLTLKCLTEIAALDVPAGSDAAPDLAEPYTVLFRNTMDAIARAVPATANFAAAYENGSDQDQEFVQNLAQFLVTFLAKHAAVAERAIPDAAILANQYVVSIAYVDDREVFKVCLEYWTKWVADMYEEMQQAAGKVAAASAAVGNGAGIGLLNLGTPSAPAAAPAVPRIRKDVYASILVQLRRVSIERMVKPEEVLVVENDDGQIVREAMKEVDTIVLYKSMREVLVYLTHLDPFNTEDIMLEKLQRQIDGSEWSWSNLNQLCWAVGSISGAMSEDHEKNFLVQVIKELLGLVDQKKGKDNKAVVAANIMYVVGQYPRFLKAHWRFLKTVVKKLFEFMHELHEGVQDMACDTYIKIAQKTRKHFVVQQPGETMPFIDEILAHLGEHTQDLQPQQISVFFEATGHLIAAQLNRPVQERLVHDLMALPNTAWDAIMAQAAGGAPVLDDTDTVKSLANVLRINTAACSAIGAGFRKQIEKIYLDMLGMYRAASGSILRSLQHDSATGFARPLVRSLRAIKKESLRLVETYTARAAPEDLNVLATDMVPLLLDACLGDYAGNPPQTRDAEVLHVIASIVNKLGRLMNSQVGPILQSVFACTLEMINKEMVEYPEHRTGFFKLLEALVKHCFDAIVLLPADLFQQVMNSVIWGFKHTMRDIGNRSLVIVEDLLENFSKAPADVANAFYQQYYLQLLSDVFFVLTDREHKAGFSSQTKVLARLMYIVTSGQLQAPLAPAAANGGVAGEPNIAFLRGHLTTMLQNAFPHVSPKAINVIVVGLLELNADAAKFKPHVRDFLIQLKEYVGDADDLYLEEREREIAQQRQAQLQAALRIPGLVKPSEQDDDED